MCNFLLSSKIGCEVVSIVAPKTNHLCDSISQTISLFLLGYEKSDFFCIKNCQNYYYFSRIYIFLLNLGQISDLNTLRVDLLVPFVVCWFHPL